jgi:hypothetical protein
VLGGEFVGGCDEGLGDEVKGTLKEEGAGEEEGGTVEVAKFVGGQLLVDFPRNVDFEVDVLLGTGQKVMLRHALLNFVISLLRFHQYKFIRAAPLTH